MIITNFIRTIFSRYYTRSGNVPSILLLEKHTLSKNYFTVVVTYTRPAQAGNVISRPNP